MPVVNLPDDLTEQLEQSASGKINNTDGPGVAVYWSSDGRTRADIYVGLKLDGFKLYKNISTVEPNIKMQFAISPIVSCKSDDDGDGDVDFNPKTDKLISIKVSCRLSLPKLPFMKFITH